jgi:hypothetical protein
MRSQAFLRFGRAQLLRARAKGWEIARGKIMDRPMKVARSRFYNDKFCSHTNAGDSARKKTECWRRVPLSVISHFVF